MLDATGLASAETLILDPCVSVARQRLTRFYFKHLVADLRAMCRRCVAPHRHSRERPGARQSGEDVGAGSSAPMLGNDRLLYGHTQSLATYFESLMSMACSLLGVLDPPCQRTGLGHGVGSTPCF